MPFFEHKGNNLFYNRVGNGKTALLFIHGLFGDSTTWPYQAAYFKENYELILIDCYGHGQSGKNISSLEWPRLTAEASVALMSEIGKPWYVIGHSFASNILPEIIKIAVTDSTLLGAVFVDCTYQGFDHIISSRVKFAERMLALSDEALPKEAQLWYTGLIGNKVPDKDVENLLLNSFHNSNFKWMFESVKACRDYCRKYPPEQTPKWEGQKIFVIEGGKTIGNDFDKSWVNFFKDARYYLFEDDYHFFYISQHESFNRLLERFFEGND